MTTPGIIEQLDRCLAFENELIATVGEEFYMWIADRAAKRAHPAPSAENEGGADYEAKAQRLYGKLQLLSYSEKIRAVAAALSQSAADERKRCEKLVRAHGVNGCERGMTDPSTGAFECRRADRGDCNCYEFDELADAIAARAEERGGEMSDPRRHVSIDYENYRGERRWRTIEPRRLEFENNEFHPETQWILYATDVERGVERGFALRDIHAWQPKSSP